MDDTGVGVVISMSHGVRQKQKLIGFGGYTTV